MMREPLYGFITFTNPGREYNRKGKSVIVVQQSVITADGPGLLVLLQPYQGVLVLPLSGGERVNSDVIVRETYENLEIKLLPRNFFTNVFVKVCNDMC